MDNTLFGNVSEKVLDVVRSESYLQNTERIDNLISLLMENTHEQERDTK